MRKIVHRQRKPKVRGVNLAIVFTLLVVLPASFFIADLIGMSPSEPQNNAAGTQMASTPKASDNRPLFDVKVIVLPEYKNAAAGSKMLATVYLKNLGSPGQPIDVELTIALANANGTTIYVYSKDTLAIATQLSVVRELLIPADLRAGTYLFVASVKYDSQTADSYDSFTITALRKEIIDSRIIQQVLFIALLILIVITAAILLKHFAVKH